MNTGDKNTKGRAILKGPRGGLYVVGEENNLDWSQTDDTCNRRDYCKVIQKCVV
jgi:hypothetical protein